jgi:hypothetical protein
MQAREVAMTKLSTIDAEARRLAGRAPEAEQRAFQAALIACCENYWEGLRGPPPPQALAQTLWSVPPPLAELFVDMLRSGDARLADVLAGLKPARALAALVLAEIERGNAEGVHIAYEAMMLFESSQAGLVYAERVAAALRAPHPGRVVHPPAAREPLWKALAEIVAHTARHDLGAVCAVIRLLVLVPSASPDVALEALRAALQALGVRFLGLDAALLRFEAHGREHKPATRKHLAALLAELRELRLA